MFAVDKNCIIRLKICTVLYLLTYPGLCRMWSSECWKRRTWGEGGFNTVMFPTTCKTSIILCASPGQWYRQTEVFVNIAEQRVKFAVHLTTSLNRSQRGSRNKAVRHSDEANGKIITKLFHSNNQSQFTDRLPGWTYRIGVFYQLVSCSVRLRCSDGQNLKPEIAFKHNSVYILSTASCVGEGTLRVKHQNAVHQLEEAVMLSS